MNETTERVFHAISNLLAAHGYSPTVREIMWEAGVSSSSVVTYHLVRLARVGRIEWTPGRPRTIRIRKAANMIE